eukprot:m.242676 g.242676  ORF g.242676 m.242676 type:complete len:74 (+) comp36087_c0_seq1:237-458(+)
MGRCCAVLCKLFKLTSKLKRHKACKSFPQCCSLQCIIMGEKHRFVKLNKNPNKKKKKIEKKSKLKTSVSTQRS